MKFKPFSEKYDYKEASLVAAFPEYMHVPVTRWLFEIMRYEVLEHDSYRGVFWLKDNFNDILNIELREKFPDDWNDFVSFAFSDNDRLCNILAFCLQNFANKEAADSLEYILSQGGSAYSVVKINKSAADYTKGAYDLEYRVSKVIINQAEKTLNENELLQEAWHFCYSRKPDYEKVVTRCCDFLEGYLGKQYFPTDPKPQLKKFVHQLRENPKNLKYKGSSIVNPKSLPIDLLENATFVRGQHTQGKGRKPTKEEAEFVLETSIFIWSLHER